MGLRIGVPAMLQAGVPNGLGTLDGSGHQPVGQASPLVVSGTSRTVTAATVITTADNIVYIDASSAPIAQPLPASSGFTGKRITLSAVTLGPNLVTITPASGSINGQPSVTLGSPTSSAQYQSIDIVPLGANWAVV